MRSRLGARVSVTGGGEERPGDDRLLRERGAGGRNGGGDRGRPYRTGDHAPTGEAVDRVGASGRTND